MGVRPMGRGKSAMWMAGRGGPPNGGHRGLAPAGGWSSGMHPPLSSSQSPLSSVSACGENCARSLAPPLPTARGAAGPHLETSHRKWAAPGGKGKMFRRVGLRRRRPPAAGGRRLAIPCGGQGRKRPALGGNLQPGEIRDTSSFSFRCRWPVVDESLRSGPMRASASTTARAARSEAERAEREAGQMRFCTPTPSAPSATGRQYRPHRRPKRARRQGQIGAGTDPPIPVARRATAPERVKAVFSFGPCTARFLFGQDRKENGGCIPLDQPPGGSQHPRGRRPAAPTAPGRPAHPATGHRNPPGRSA